MPRYRIADLTFDSAISLPADRAAAPAPGCLWRFVVERGLRPAPCRWYHHETLAQGERWRSLGRIGDQHVIRFRRTASFAVSFGRHTVTCHAGPSVGVDEIRQLFLGHVVPLVVAERGALALHASAVLTPRGVLAFVAPSGGGKSTLALALAVRGCALVADDCTIVDVDGEHCTVRPLHVGVRLRPDSLRMLSRSPWRTAHEARRRGGKRRVTAQALGCRARHAAAPLDRVYFLDRHDRTGVSVEPLPLARAVVALMIASFQLGVDEPARLRRAFDALTALVTQRPVLRLSMPRGLEHLPSVAEALLDRPGGGRVSERAVGRR